MYAQLSDTSDVRCVEGRGGSALRRRHADRERTICFNEREQVTDMGHAPHAAAHMAAMASPAADDGCTSPPDDKLGPPTDFLLNGMTFDPEHVAVTMKLDSVEEWTLVNANTEWHTFHIHVKPFQVVSVNGRRVSHVDYEDNVALAPGSSTVIRMHPTDWRGSSSSTATSPTTRIAGMMAAVQVLRHPSAAQLAASAAGGDGMSMRSGEFGAGHE